MKPTIHTHLAADTTTAIAEAIRSVSARAREATITRKTLLLEDLALDSLDMVAVVVELQDRFDVEIDPDEITVIRTVGDLADSLERYLRRAA
ncbi:MAG: acyl carrier protein [Isosphaeraceae bacterium]